MQLYKAQGIAKYNKQKCRSYTDSQISRQIQVIPVNTFLRKVTKSEFFHTLYQWHYRNRKIPDNFSTQLQPTPSELLGTIIVTKRKELLGCMCVSEYQKTKEPEKLQVYFEEKRRNI